ncbi:hypothetical protein HA402_003263 [Bradysia odoriphaga]|nr:hypothetical protein HA402_003263 [Bradysia odoriphaga]
MIKKHNKHEILPPWPSFDKVPLTTFINLAYLSLALLVTSINCHRPPCLEQSWWDEKTDSCIPCTICDEQSIVLRPCQPHKDVICGTLNDLEYDWNGIVEQDQAIESDSWAERSKDTESASQDAYINIWSWQVASLVLVAIACLIFFIVLILILCQHAKHWRQMKQLERRFDRDVEELSARLMHTIVDIRSIENGQIILEESNKERVFNPLEVRCVYLEQLLVGKNLVKNPGRGNVYIEDANSTK